LQGMNSHVFGESARIKMHALECVAGGFVATHASRAGSARDMVKDENPVAGFETGDAIADLLDDSGELMSEDAWSRVDTVELVDIGSADSDSHDFEEHLAVSDFRDRSFLDTYVVVSVVDSRLHCTGEFSGFKGMRQDLTPQPPLHKVERGSGERTGHKKNGSEDPLGILR